MAGNLESYRFRGMQAEGQGTSLDEAIEELRDFWGSRPSLVTKDWGVLTLKITIGSTEATVEITDPDILDAAEVDGDLNPLIDKLAEAMQLDRRDAEVLLSESSGVVAVVDRIRSPVEPDGWTPEPGTAPETVLPDATVAWVRDVSKAVDAEAKRNKGRIRTKRGRALLRMVVESGSEQGLSDAQISRRTGVARSTVRDARIRVTRDRRVVAEFRTRKPGQRYTPEQRKLVLERLSEAKGNAAATARELGLAPRTVRDIRARAATKPRVSRTYTAADKRKLMKLVVQGMTPTAAGRKLQIPERTARGWAKKAKRGKETK